MMGVVGRYSVGRLNGWPGVVWSSGDLKLDPLVASGWIGVSLCKVV